MGNAGNILGKLVTFIGLALPLVGCNNPSGPIPTGTLDDVMRDEASFYSIRGGSDYDRLPLKYPFHIVDITGEPALCNGKVILVNNILALNIYSNLVYGSYGSSTSFGEVHAGGWFVIDSLARTNVLSSDEPTFQKTLINHGITNMTLRPVNPLIKDFMHKGLLPFEH